MEKKCLFFSKMSLDSIGQDEGDDPFVGWSLHPFNKLLFSARCVLNINTRAHAFQNSMTEGRGHSGHGNANSSVNVLGLGHEESLLEGGEPESLSG